MNKIFRLFFVFITFAIGLMVLAVTAIHTSVLQKEALVYITRNLQKTGQYLAFKNVQMIFPFKIRGDEVVYSSDDGDQVILKNIEIDIEISSLIKRGPYIKNIILEDLWINLSSKNSKALDLSIYNDIRDFLYIIHQNYIKQLTIKHIKVGTFNESFSVQFNPTSTGPELKIFEQSHSPLFCLKLLTLKDKEDFEFNYFHNSGSVFLNHLFSFFEQERCALEKIVGHIQIDKKHDVFEAKLNTNFIFSTGNIFCNAHLKNIDSLFIEVTNSTPFSLPFIGQLSAIQIDINQFNKNSFNLQNSWIKGMDNSVEISGKFENKESNFENFLTHLDADLKFSIAGSMISHHFYDEKIEGTVAFKIKDDLYNVQLESPITSLKSKFLKVFLSEQLKIDAEKDANNTSIVLQGFKGNKIKIECDNQLNDIKISLGKKIEQSLLENMKVSIKKDVKNYHIKGIILPIGKNSINFDFLFDPYHNRFLKGQMALDIKDMAPLTTPFDFATVGEIEMKVLFDYFSLTQKAGVAHINFESKFFRSPIFKSARTTLKGKLKGDLTPDFKFTMEELAIGKNFLAQETSATLKRKDSFYNLNLKSHSHKKGYLSSDLDILLDIDFQKDGLFIKCNALDIYHLKQAIKATDSFYINLDSFGIPKAHFLINKGTLSFNNIFQPTSLKPYWTGEVNLQKLPLGLMSWFIPKTLMTGEIDGKISLKGKKKIPDFSLLIKGEQVQWRQLHTDSTFKESFLNFNINMELLNEILTYSANLNGVNLANCFFKGRVPIHLNSIEPFECFFKGSINLTLISLILSTSDRLKGNINFDLNLAGSLTDPIWRGEISTNDAYIELAEYGTIINNIKGRIVANNKKWTVQKFTADDTPLLGKKKKGHVGSLFLDGSFYFNTLLTPDIDLKLQLSQYLVVNTDSLKGITDAVLKIKGEGIYSKITGTASFNQFLVDLKKWDTDDSIPSIDLRDPKKRQYAKDYQKEKFDKESRPILPLNLLLKTNGILSLISDDVRESIWGGDVLVQGSLTDPYLNGSLSVVKGNMSLLDKTLIIESGKVTFLEHDQNEPSFTIIASRKIGDITIRIFIDNKQDPMLVFDSSPSMSQSDILSWLLFGKDTLTISAGESIQLAMAISQVSSNKIFSTVFSPIEGFRKILGFDTLEIRGQDSSTSSNIEQDSKNVVHLGKKITDSIEVSIEQGTDQQTTSFGVEMDVGNNVIIDADFSKNSADNANIGRTTGAGFRWSKRY